MTTTPDFRALCAELVNACNGTDMSFWWEALDRAEVALATPPPELPNFDEVLTVYTQTFQETFMQGRNNLQDCKVAGLRAVLERWGK